MLFQELSDFIKNRMRMSHIYQPVMLMTLLRNDGVCHERVIVAALLERDESQIEYYTRITNNMVGRVLRNHEYVARDRKNKTCRLINYEALNGEQVQRLIDLCQLRLDNFLEARGRKIFDHRRKSAGYISGTLRYEVLKKAKCHRELCGISADVKALEVDHIIPRNLNGSDDISNLQALCYSCNAMKRDRDTTDFRVVRNSYELREKGCLFCVVNNDRIVGSNELAYVIRDAFPVTELHTLIIPKRHVRTYFELGQAEINACNWLLLDEKPHITSQDNAVTGFNIGINDGESAGQTILHCHIHLIPRRVGDVENPRGSIRHTIPGKGYY